MAPMSDGVFSIFGRRLATVARVYRGGDQARPMTLEERLMSDPAFRAVVQRFAAEKYEQIEGSIDTLNKAISGWQPVMAESIRRFADFAAAFRPMSRRERIKYRLSESVIAVRWWAAEKYEQIKDSDPLWLVFPLLAMLAALVVVVLNVK